jgi:CHAD domain-containing protein
LKNELKAFDVNFFSKLISNLKSESENYLSSPLNQKISPNEIACMRFNGVISRFKLAKQDNVGSIHKVRLSFKKFRYTMEIIQPLKNFEPEVFLEMSDFQTILGNIQDHTVFIRKIFEFSESQEHVSKELFKPIEEEQIIEREKLIEDFFSNFNKFYSFWKPEYLTK